MNTTLETWNQYIIFGAVFATVFFLTAMGALLWAIKNKQFSKLNDGAHSIFEEPEK